MKRFLQRAFPLKTICALMTICALALSSVSPAGATAYDGHPKLVVIIVLDQFRADYLERYRADFKGRGFRLFLDHGAWFPDCYYDYANTETAPGHATIGTGAYTDGHGIGGNQWWDLARSKEHPVTSVEDERYALVGMPTGGKTTPGASPRNLMASTVGDELRLDTLGESLVYGVSLKDRAAILTVGATANGAFWIDPASGRFLTSTYYAAQLPEWAQEFDDSDRAALAEQEANSPGTKNFFGDVGPTPAAVSYELDFAESLITGEQLGRHETPDMLAISISSPDILGHRVGPDSPEQRAMVDAVDTDLDAFFSWLDKNVDGGLANVWIALTADHGIAPVPATAAALGLNAAGIDMKKLAGDVNYAINMKFSPGEKIDYLLPDQSLPYLALNPPGFDRAGINEQEAEEAVQRALPAAFANLAQAAQAQAAGASAATASVAGAQAAGTSPARTQAAGAAAATASPAGTQAGGTAAGASAGETPASEQLPGTQTTPIQRLPPVPMLFRSFTREQMAEGRLPDTQLGRLIEHSYSPNGGWYVMIIPQAFQMAGAGGQGTNHYTPYSYDRHVPMAFYGAPFAPGMYRGRVEPVDIAATFASLLGVNQPSASVGEILTEALKPAAAFVYPTPVAPKGRRRHGRTPKGDATTPDAGAGAVNAPAVNSPSGAGTSTTPTGNSSAPTKTPNGAKTTPAGNATPAATNPTGASE